MSVCAENINQSIQLNLLNPQQHSNIQINYGIVQSPLGECLIANTDYGICKISFLANIGSIDVIEELSLEWPEASLIENDADTQMLADRVFESNGEECFEVLIKATSFQLQVWKSLLSIPVGKVCSYAEVAEAIGLPKAYRAVGSAIGQNPVAFLIPCHRVVQKSGALGGYRWGLKCKKKLLSLEESYAESRIEAAIC